MSLLRKRTNSAPAKAAPWLQAGPKPVFSSLRTTRNRGPSAPGQVDGRVARAVVDEDHLVQRGIGVGLEAAETVESQLGLVEARHDDAHPGVREIGDRGRGRRLVGHRDQVDQLGAQRGGLFQDRLALERLCTAHCVDEGVATTLVAESPDHRGSRPGPHGRGGRPRGDGHQRAIGHEAGFTHAGRPRQCPVDAQTTGQRRRRGEHDPGVGHLLEARLEHRVSGLGGELQHLRQEVRGLPRGDGGGQLVEGSARPLQAVDQDGEVDVDHALVDEDLEQDVGCIAQSAEADERLGPLLGEHVPADLEAVVVELADADPIEEGQCLFELPLGQRILPSAMSACTDVVEMARRLSIHSSASSKRPR